MSLPTASWEMDLETARPPSASGSTSPSACDERAASEKNEQPEGARRCRWISRRTTDEGEGVGECAQFKGEWQQLSLTLHSISEQ
jgi:hypothetical protein